MPMYSLHSIKTLETRRIKRFPAKTLTNVGMMQRVIKNRVRAPTHHTGNKSPDTRRGSLASLAIHNPCRSRFIAFKRLCIHCTQVNIRFLMTRCTIPTFVNVFVGNLYSVQCTQCIHRDAVYGMLQIQTMSMQVGTTLTYCIMYCTYRQCLTLLYVLAHKLTIY